MRLQKLLLRKFKDISKANKRVILGLHPLEIAVIILVLVGGGVAIIYNVTDIHSRPVKITSSSKSSTSVKQPTSNVSTPNQTSNNSSNTTTSTPSVSNTSNSNTANLSKCNSLASSEQSIATGLYNEGISDRNGDIQVVDGYITEYPTLVAEYNSDPTEGNLQNVNSNITATQNAISNYNVNIKGFNDEILQAFEFYEGSVSAQCPTLTIGSPYETIPYLPTYTAGSPWNP